MKKPYLLIIFGIFFIIVLIYYAIYWERFIQGLEMGLS
jgi:hypothetical protein